MRERDTHTQGDVQRERASKREKKKEWVSEIERGTSGSEGRTHNRQDARRNVSVGSWMSQVSAIELKLLRSTVCCQPPPCDIPDPCDKLRVRLL